MDVECSQLWGFVDLEKANDALIGGRTGMKVYVILEGYSNDEFSTCQINTVHYDKDRACQTCRELNAEVMRNNSQDNRGVGYEVEPWEVIE